MAIDISLAVVLKGHNGILWHISWSPCGDYIASCGEDKIIRIWQCHFDEDKESFDVCCISSLEDGQTRTIRCCEWSNDGNMIASSSFDGTVLLWQCQSHDNKRHWDKIASLEGHDNEVKCVAWNNDSKRLATCGRDKKIWIWEILNGGEFECISVLEGHTQDVKFLTWHPHESTIFSCSYDDTIRVWKEESDDEFYCSQVLTGHKSTVWSLSLNCNGDQFISCSDDQSLMLWQSMNGSFEYGGIAVRNNVHDGSIYSVDWNRYLQNSTGSRSGMFASVGGDNALVLTSFDEDKGIIEEIKRVDDIHAADINCVRWRHNNISPTSSTQPSVSEHLLATASDDGLIKLWKVSVS